MIFSLDGWNIVSRVSVEPCHLLVGGLIIMPKADQERGIPEWILRPVPLNAVEDDAAMAELQKLGANLPEKLFSLRYFLEEHKTLASFEPLANAAAAMI